MFFLDRIDAGRQHAKRVNSALPAESSPEPASPGQLSSSNWTDKVMVTAEVPGWIGVSNAESALVATGLDARRVSRQPIGKARRSAYNHRNMNRLFAHAHHHHHHPLWVG